MPYITKNREVQSYIDACDDSGAYWPENDVTLMGLQAEGAYKLSAAGYEAGEYNPHNVRAWVIANEYGIVAVAIGEHQQEALDNAVDDGLMDGEIMSQEDHIEHLTNGWHDSYTYAGNAGEPVWTTYQTITEIEMPEVTA